MDPNTRALTMGAAAGGAGAYIEDVFSTYLYTGNGSTQTITNGIDLAGKGGLVWIKSRSTATDNALFDTARGASNGFLRSNTTDTPYANPSSDLTSFDASGFSITNGTGNVNVSPRTYTSWTFRKQAKFFDVVTYTGNGSNRTISHSLGSVPGCIIVKRTDTAGDWQVYHRSLANTEYMVLNSTAAKATGTTRWNSTTPTSTEFSLGTDATVNANGGTYVAYLFAHDAGGFGDSGNESVVKCGSYEPDGTSNFAVDLGWEPQWLMIKTATNNDNYNGWAIFDNMRGVATGGKDPILFANQSWAEDRGVSGVDISLDYVNLTSTGFTVTSGANSTGTTFRTYIYIAIRRPNKTPTTGSSVLTLSTSTGLGIMSSNTGITSDIKTINDAVILRPYRTATTAPSWVFADALRGYGSSSSPYLNSSSTAAETTTTLVTKLADNYLNFSGATFPTISYVFRRAPGFFDVVAYTGTGSVRTVAHNLGVAPELMLIKSRNDAYQWIVFASALGATQYLSLNSTIAAGTESTVFNDTLPTASVFTLGTSVVVNSGLNYITYLFASCPGVSKVGSYTGTGTTLNIDCGFTTGARFVLIKRTDSTGDWYVWDAARGIIAANDPYLLLNSTAAEVTNTDFIDPLSSGFQISSTAPAAINANSGTFIYLAIA